MATLEERIKLCNKCRVKTRCENPRSIYCEDCLGKKEVEKLRFKADMNTTPCPECGVEIGNHTEHGFMHCLNDIKKRGYAFWKLEQHNHDGVKQN